MCVSSKATKTLPRTGVFERPAEDNAIIISSQGSSAGKTTFTLGLLEALRRRGVVVAPFKAGPDYIDPLLHTALLKRPCYNLDTWMMGEAGVRKTFSAVGKGDLRIVEGVMGLFDGRDGLDERGSTAHLAKVLNAPVLLVLDAQKTARSVAAILRGFELFDPGVKIRWVIFNRVGSERHYKILRDAVTAYSRLEVLGALPKDAGLALPERHLGLFTAGDISGSIWKRFINRAVETIERNIDLTPLLKGLRQGKGQDAPGRVKPRRSAVTIAVARDRAFCFYYRENLDLLESSGGRIRWFSPISDKRLPHGTTGIYLGGGYPELYGKALEKNRSMRDEIKAASDAGMPIFAECGGLMYLGRALKDASGETFGMSGVFPFSTRMLKKRKSLGYREAVVNDACPFLGRGEVVRGHEFHYSELSGKTPAGIRNVFAKGVSPEGFLLRNTLATYMHLHFASNRAFADGFVRSCEKYAKEGGG